MSDKTLNVVVSPYNGRVDSFVRGIPIRVVNVTPIPLNIMAGLMGGRLVVTIEEHAPPTSTELKK